MEKVLEALRFLNGYKTYFVGALMIILGIIQSDNELILQGIGLMTIRKGIAGYKK
ncbi:MAG: hypothetical protein PF542_06485 [Nanoarchaeota archaeon]|jgi:hypothetical protein|nr:hypothetical protein [Nanoarchaeota archaeon]